MSGHPHQRVKYAIRLTPRRIHTVNKNGDRWGRGNHRLRPRTKQKDKNTNHAHHGHAFPGDQSWQQLCRSLCTVSSLCASVWSGAVPPHEVWGTIAKYSVRNQTIREGVAKLPKSSHSVKLDPAPEHANGTVVAFGASVVSATVVASAVVCVPTASGRSSTRAQLRKRMLV